MSINLSKSTCLVLGGGGFLGKNLCLTLANAGSAVIGFDRVSCPQELEGVVKWKTGDFANVRDYADEVESADVIFHLVSSTVPGTSNNDIGFDIESNLISSIRLLEHCRKIKGKRIIYASSGGAIYGIPEEFPASELSHPQPISSYGIVKLTTEKYLNLYQHLYGLDYRVLRVANPFGPFQMGKGHQGAIASFLYRSLTGQAIDIWGDGEVVRDYVYVDDVMSAFCASCTHNGAQRVFNIGSGVGRSLNSIIMDIVRITGKEVPVRYLDARKADVPRIVLDCARAERDLAWIPSVDFDEALVRSANWMKSQI